MICKRCGNRVEEGQRFCSNCGADAQFFEQEHTNYPGAGPNNIGYDYNGQQNNNNNKNKNKKIIISVIVIAVIAVIALAAVIGIVHSSHQNSDLEKALDSKNASQVNMVYSEAKNKGKNLDKYDKLIGKTIQKITEDVNTHDFEPEALNSGDDALFQYLLSEWGSLVIGDDNTDDYLMQKSISVDNQADWNNLKKLVGSKSNFCEAIFCYKTEKDYYEAVSIFAEMDPIDSEYDNGMNCLQECVDLYVQDDLNEIVQKISDGNLNEGISELETLKSELDAMGENSEAVNKKIEETLKIKADSYMKKAEEYFKSEDINAAIGHAEAANSIYPDDSYEAKLEEYKLYLPVPLYKEEKVLKISQDEDYWGMLYFDRTVKANNNEEYPHCIKWYNNNNTNTTKAKLKAEYVLNGKYNLLSGTFLLPQDERDTTMVGHFEICGDGKVIYTSPEITSGVLPEEFSCDVSGVQNLTINFYGQGTGGFVSSGSEFAVSDLIVKKTFDKE